MNNLIKNEAKTAGVRLWQIADKLGFTDSTFSRKLRKEFTEAEKQEVLQIIKTIQEENVNG